MFTHEMTTSVIKQFEIIILYYPGRCNTITGFLKRERVEVRVDDVIMEAKLRERWRKEVQRCCGFDPGEKGQ